MYQDMVAGLDLSYRQLESANCFGPFFWSVTCKSSMYPRNDHLRQYIETAHLFVLILADQKKLELIYRNIAGTKVGQCHGWELSLTYRPDANATTGFFRGTKDSLLDDCITHLQKSYKLAGNPLLLPTIVLAHEMDGISNTDIRCSYGWLQRAEDSLSEIANSSHHTTETLIRLNKVEKNLLQVHKNVLQRKPKVNLQVVENFERTVAESVALDKPETSVEFKERLLQERRKIDGAIAFYKMKLKGIDTEVSDAMSRIQLLRSTIRNQLSVTLAVIQQNRDDKKHKATIHYSNNQQLFAALDVFFLPGTFFAVSSVREMICGSNRS
jgi:hypothetical protein